MHQRNWIKVCLASSLAVSLNVSHAAITPTSCARPQLPSWRRLEVFTLQRENISRGCSMLKKPCPGLPCLGTDHFCTWQDARLPARHLSVKQSLISSYLESTHRCSTVQGLPIFLKTLPIKLSVGGVREHLAIRRLLFALTAGYVPTPPPSTAWRALKTVFARRRYFGLGKTIMSDFHSFLTMLWMSKNKLIVAYEGLKRNGKRASYWGYVMTKQPDVSTDAIWLQQWLGTGL